MLIGEMGIRRSASSTPDFKRLGFSGTLLVCETFSHEVNVSPESQDKKLRYGLEGIIGKSKSKCQRLSLGLRIAASNYNRQLLTKFPVVNTQG